MYETHLSIFLITTYSNLFQENNIKFNRIDICKVLHLEFEIEEMSQKV